MWTERQQAMLQAMGLRVWAPVPATMAAAEPAPLEAATPVAAVRSGAALQAVPHADALASQPLPRSATPPSASPSSPPSSPSTSAPTSAPTSRLTPPERARPTAPLATRTLASPAGGAVAVPAALAALDLDGLRQVVSSCQACGLCTSRTQTVFGVGHAQAHWMIIGEAPGEQEDRRGEPFVGPAGQLLDNMLAALQLTRADASAAQQVFIANTLKCRPPSNRNPSPEELAQCVPYLQRQIALVQPRIILAMGKFAALALLGSDAPLGKLRGQVHHSALAPGVPVIVSYHPAYLLRQPTEKAKAWEDLCLAASVYEASLKQDSLKQASI